MCETGHKTDDCSPSAIQDEQKLKAGDWARVLEAATQRRTEVLMPENLENMWSRGRNYRNKEANRVRGEVEEPLLSKSAGSLFTSHLRESHTSLNGDTIGPKEKKIVHINNTSAIDASLTQEGDFKMDDSSADNKELFVEDNHEEELKDTVNLDANGERSGIERSNGTSALKVEPDSEKAFTGEAGGHIISKLHCPSLCSCSGEHKLKNVLDVVYGSQGSHTLKLRCRVRKVLSCP